MSDTWTGSTRFTALDEKPPDGYTWSGWRQDPTMRGQIRGNKVPMHQNVKKSKSGLSKNHSLTMPEDCVVFLIDPNDEEFKDIMKNARGKWEVPMPAAIPCKIQREKYRETCRVEKNCKTKYACIYEEAHGRISAQVS